MFVLRSALDSVLHEVWSKNPLGNYLKLILTVGVFLRYFLLMGSDAHRHPATILGETIMAQTIYVTSSGCALSHAQMVAISAADLMAKAELEARRIPQTNVSLMAPLARLNPHQQ